MRVSNQVLGIGIPCSWTHVPIAFFNSFTLMEKPSYQFITADNGPVDALRNNIVEKAKRIGVTKLLLPDVDQVYPVDTIAKLLRHKLPIVGAKICRRYPPFDPIIMNITDRGYEPFEDYEPGSLVECDATGSGCVLYDMSVFADMDRRAQSEIDSFNAMKPTTEEMSSFPVSTREYIYGLQSRCFHPHVPGVYFRFQKNPDNGLVIGEDIGFCQDLKAAGYKIFVDTSIEIGHLSTMVVNDATHRLYKEMECAKELRNKAIGISEK